MVNKVEALSETELESASTLCATVGNPVSTLAGLKSSTEKHLHRCLASICSLDLKGSELSKLQRLHFETFLSLDASLGHIFGLG